MPHEIVKEKILNLLKSKERIVVAIDGRCASGKTTFAQVLGHELSCNVIHMDNFFLRHSQRTKQRLNEPGGNVDRERFLTEVLQPLCKGEEFSYRPYVCRTDSFGEPVAVKPGTVNIIEGSYSCHPDLWDFYDLHIFLSIPKKLQLERILKRNGKKALCAFKDKWIPLEEKYFEAFDIEKRCDVSFCIL